MTPIQFNAVLLDISNQLSAEDMVNIKFLVPEIGKRKLEKIDTGLKLFDVLTQRGQLSANNTDFLSRLLKEIKRQDLVDKLDGHEAPPDNEPDETEKAKLEIATQVISENLGKSWRKLGRKLRVSDVKLESISKQHPTDLEETAVELLKEWRKIQGPHARTKDLIDALRSCLLNLTADKVEDKLTEQGH
ncbi:protein FADD [Mugil cephalus]|uniref:protein FADD n=1 Tax=Mugil cephalus TaxID=48193 RepID=UPI001FB5F8C8|nr:protein FADD [Mugil cephalus]